MSYSISDHYDRYDEEWVSDRPSRVEAERDERECSPPPPSAREQPFRREDFALDPSDRPRV